ncbi:hypothetical protein FN846DRAFT_670531 [Sphaerosporella brunnea]|uniref:Secreted protein n=1 Tax=Sphaerosporella brunnea TaxID=1250544 RepID=A0A5J5FAE4_9PEZI|nr:hypothetical protein FN846DRAFT_670531 [Sphaerosporella brunnea]
MPETAARQTTVLLFVGLSCFPSELIFAIHPNNTTATTSTSRRSLRPNHFGLQLHILRGNRLLPSKIQQAIVQPAGKHTQDTDNTDQQRQQLAGTEQILVDLHSTKSQSILRKPDTQRQRRQQLQNVTYIRRGPIHMHPLNRSVFRRPIFRIQRPVHLSGPIAHAIDPRQPGTQTDVPHLREGAKDILLRPQGRSSNPHKYQDYNPHSRNRHDTQPLR